MKIGFINHTGELGGGEIALLEVIRALRGKVEPFVILGADGPFVDRLCQESIPTVILPLPDGARAVRLQSGLRAIPKSLRVAPVIPRLARMLRSVDVVHTNSMKAHLYGGVAARLAGRPLLWHVRDRLHESYMAQPLRGIARSSARLLPHAIVANSRETMKWVPLRSRMSRTVLYSPVADEFFDLPAPQPSDKLRIGMIGRIVPWKGQDLFIEALARLKEANVEFTAMIIGAPVFGDRADADRLRRRASELNLDDYLTWTGFTDRVPDFVRDLDVVVHASIIPEPFGQVVAQGMAAGRCVVTPMAGGPAEFARDGENAITYRMGSVDSLEAALRRSLDESLRLYLAGPARKTAEQFRSTTVSAELLNIYEQLVSP